jgi:hypothetical protein
MWFMQEKHPIRSKTVKDGSVNNFLTLSLTRQPITSCCLSLRFGSNVSEKLARAMSHIGPCFSIFRPFKLFQSTWMLLLIPNKQSSFYTTQPEQVTL